MLIEVDGREVGRLNDGQSLVTYVESGRHKLRARQWFVNSEPLELELTPGADVQLETRYEVTVWNYWLVLVPTTAPSMRLTPQVLGKTETNRSEEPNGTQNVLIDNRSDAASLTRTMRVTREWSRTVSLDLIAGSGVSAEVKGGPPWLAMGKSVEKSLSRDYGVEENRREEFAEEFSVQVEPGNTVTVVLTWKRLWQHGLVHVLFQGQRVDIPFQVAVGVTFDQSLV